MLIDLHTGRETTRRGMLRTSFNGLGGLALASLLGDETNAAVKQPHHAPKAKNCICIFMAGAPSHFRSSPGVRRGFCSACGSALTYEGDRWPGEVHVHIGCLDEPEAFPPQGHAFADTERISWLHIADIPSSESDG